MCRGRNSFCNVTQLRPVSLLPQQGARTPVTVLPMQWVLLGPIGENPSPRIILYICSWMHGRKNIKKMQVPMWRRTVSPKDLTESPPWPALAVVGQIRTSGSSALRYWVCVLWLCLCLGPSKHRRHLRAVSVERWGDQGIEALPLLCHWWNAVAKSMNTSTFCMYPAQKPSVHVMFSTRVKGVFRKQPGMQRQGLCEHEEGTNSGRWRHSAHTD